MADIFISYSRSDSPFAQRLAGELKGRGKEVWIDVVGIEDGEVFPAALRRAIESSDAFVFVITPESVGSPFCEQEIAHACELNKRIVPLALRPVPDDQIPAEIRFRNWIPIDDDGTFLAGVDRLCSAVDNDLDWERRHTRVTVKALEWEAAGRDRSFLLRGADLATGERWLAAGAGKDPGPSARAHEYLIASRNAAARRQRSLLTATAAVALVSIGLLVFAVISRSQAINARNGARAQALAAESQVELSVDPERSVLLASAAVRDSPTPQATLALRDALDRSAIRYRLPDAGLQSCDDPSVAFSPDDREAAETLCNGTLILDGYRTDHVIRRVHLAAHAQSVAYSPSGSLLAVDVAGSDYPAADRGRVLLIDAATGAVRARGPRIDPSSRIAFSPTGSVIAAPSPNAVALWNTITGRVRHLKLPGRLASLVTSVTFSPDGKQLAAAITYPHTGPSPGVIVLNVASGRILATVATSAEGIAYSPAGRQLYVAETLAGFGTSQVVVLNSRTLHLEHKLVSGIVGLLTALAVSPDGTRLVYGDDGGAAAVISTGTGALPAGERIVTYPGQTSSIVQVAFTPDGQLAATASQDGTVRIWRAVGIENASFIDLTPWTGYENFAPLNDGVVGVTGSPDGGYEIVRWSANGKVVGKPLAISPPTSIEPILSPDGTLAGAQLGSQLTRSGVAPLKIWSVAQRRVIRTLARIPVADPVFGSVSPNNRWLAIGTRQAGGGGNFVIVNLMTGRYVIYGHTSCSEGWGDASFSQASDLVVAPTYCGDVYVWHVPTGTPVGRPFSVGGNVYSVALSPDRREIAVASLDGVVTIVNVETDQTVATLIGNTAAVEAVSYSPNGRYLATTGNDSTVRIWDARTLSPLRVIQLGAFGGTVYFTPNSRYIFAAHTYNNDGFEYSVCPNCGNPHALLRLAATRVTRHLTAAERDTYGVG